MAQTKGAGEEGRERGRQERASHTSSPSCRASRQFIHIKPSWLILCIIEPAEVQGADIIFLSYFNHQSVTQEFVGGGLGGSVWAGSRVGDKQGGVHSLNKAGLATRVRPALLTPVPMASCVPSIHSRFTSKHGKSSSSPLYFTDFCPRKQEKEERIHGQPGEKVSLLTGWFYLLGQIHQAG